MITKEEMAAEMAGLDQQEAHWRETVAKADAVRQNALNMIEAVTGAKQMLSHLMKRVEDKEKAEADKPIDATVQD